MPEPTTQPPAIADHERQPAFEFFEASRVSPFVTSDILDLIPAIAIPGYECYFPDLASRGQLGGLINENHEIYRFGDKRLLWRVRRFGNEAFQPNQTTQGIIGVNRRGSAGMSRIPGLEHRMRLRAANLADH